MTAGFKVEGDAGCALGHIMTEGALEVTTTMSEGIICAAGLVHVVG